MRMGVTTYSFVSKVFDEKWDWYDVIRKSAELGFEGMELANLTDEWLRDVKYTPEGLKKAAADCGIELCSWVLSADYAQDTDDTVKRVMDEIDVAHFLGVKHVRTDVCGEDAPDPFAVQIIGALRKIADHCAGYGMTLTTENHGGYFCRPERLEQLCRAVNRPNYGLLCDPANYADADEDPLRAIAKTKRLIRHVHMKDCHLLPGDRVFPGRGWYLTQGGNYLRCAITGQGNIPYYQCVKALAEAGYDGWLIQEFEGIEDCVYAVSQGLGFARRLLQALPAGVWREGI